MARVALTRLDLKLQRERLARFERFLPSLQLRQQQLQSALRGVEARRRETNARLAAAEAVFEQYRAVTGDLAGFELTSLAEPRDVRLARGNVAGVEIPVLEAVEFRPVSYSLFGTPPWVDRALQDLRAVARHRAEADVLERQYRRLRRELVRVVQRVNLFEKIKIPEAREAIRRIRVHLADEMSAAVGRAKLARSRIAARQEAAEVGPTAPGAEPDPSRRRRAP